MYFTFTIKTAYSKNRHRGRTRLTSAVMKLMDGSMKPIDFKYATYLKSYMPLREFLDGKPLSEQLGNTFVFELISVIFNNEARTMKFYGRTRRNSYSEVLETLMKIGAPVYMHIAGDGDVDTWTRGEYFPKFIIHVASPFHSGPLIAALSECSQEEAYEDSENKLIVELK